MAKVHHRKARKDYPANGIVKGDMYYTTNIKTGPRSSRTIRQLTPIRPSQMTTSPYLGMIYAAEEAMNDWPEVAELEAGDVRGMFESISEARDQAQEAFDNMPESLQQSETGQRLEARVSYCDEAETHFDELANHIDERPDQPGSFDVEEPDEGDDKYVDDPDAYEADMAEFADAQEAHDDEQSEWDEWLSSAESLLEEVQGLEYDE